MNHIMWLIAVNLKSIKLKKKKWNDSIWPTSIVFGIFKWWAIIIAIIHFVSLRFCQNYVSLKNVFIWWRISFCTSIMWPDRDIIIAAFKTLVRFIIQLIHTVVNSKLWAFLFRVEGNSGLILFHFWS